MPVSGVILTCTIDEGTVRSMLSGTDTKPLDLMVSGWKHNHYNYDCFSLWVHTLCIVMRTHGQAQTNEERSGHEDTDGRNQWPPSSGLVGLSKIILANCLNEVLSLFKTLLIFHSEKASKV